MGKQHFVVAGTSIQLVRQILLALKLQGKSVGHVIGGEETAELRWTMLCEDNHVINFDRADRPSDDRVFIKLVNDYARRLPNLILIPADVEGAKMIARTRHALPVRITPVAPPALLDVLNDKWQFFRLCTLHGLRVPKTVYLGDKSGIGFDRLAAELGLPMIIKPTDQAGSAGVQLVRDEQDFERLIRQNPSYQFDRLIAQQYIDGVDLCFNLLAVDGQLHAHSLQRRDRNIVSFLSIPELEAMGSKLADVTRYSGAMCIDARWESGTGQVYLIESNPRFWASLNASAWCGLNFVTQAALLAAGADAGLQILSAGRFNERHPLLRPTAWLRMLAVSGPKGRFLRSCLTDLPMLWRVLKAQWQQVRLRRLRRGSTAAAGRT